MEIIRATAADAAALSAIARAAKAHWGYPPRLLEQWREQLMITPEFIAAHETFGAVCNGQIVAFHALVATAGTMRLEHLWVSPPQIGRGIGRALFAHAAARAAQLDAPCVTIEADPHAEAFYLHLGAVPRGTTPSEIPGRELQILVFRITTSNLRALEKEKASDGNSKSPRRSRS